jgi:hypothetical protein
VLAVGQVRTRLEPELSLEPSHTPYKQPKLGGGAAFSGRFQALPPRTGLADGVMRPAIRVMSIRLSWDVPHSRQALHPAELTRAPEGLC